MKRLVALQLEATADLLDRVEAVWAGGDAVALLPPALPPTALRDTLAALRPDRLVRPGASWAVPDGQPVGDEVDLVLATSGSTGAPKGVELGRAALAASTSAGLRRLGATAADRWLCCLPVHHAGGLQVLLRARHLGTDPIVLERFDVEAVAAAREATMVSLVPTMLHRLLAAGADLSHLRCVLLGGAPADPDLLRRSARAGVTVVTTYGMTETCGGCVYDGRPLDGVEVALDAGGTILLRGDVLFSGYRLRPDLTAAALRDGWLRTADLGELRDGVLRVLGRHDDVIVSGGENVSAVAVAGVLGDHPGVAEAAVVGVADPEWGQRVVAYVVPAGTPPSHDALRDWVAARLGRAAAPREVRVVAALPRLGSGKVDRVTLRDGM